jgi:hypothetical protein
MTRKDYILIAEALRTTIQLNSSEGPDSDFMKGIHASASHIANALGRNNPRFNREHFLAVIRGEKDLNSRPKRS